MKLNRFPYVLFVLLPVLAQYRFLPGISIGEAALLIALIINHKRRPIVVNKWLIAIHIFIVLHTLILLIVHPQYLYDTTTIIKSSVRSTYLIIMIVLIISQFKLQLLQKYLVYAGIIYSIILLIQAGYFYMFKISLWDGTLPYLHRYSEARTQEYRFSSMLSEPSAFGAFMLPVIFLELDSKNYKKAILFSISIIVSTSTLGIMGTIIIWGGFLFVDKGQKYLQVSITLLLVLVLIGLNTYFAKGFLDYGINKLININIYSDPRLIKGFSLYWDIPFDVKIIGTGLGQAASFAFHNGIYIDYGFITNEMNEYMNAAAAVLIYYGLVGVFFTFMFFKDIKDGLAVEYFPLFIVILFLFFTSEAFIYNNYFITIFIILNLYNDNIKQLRITL